MHAIDGTNITLTRGDTLFLQIALTRDGESITPAEGSEVRFAMKRKYTDAEPVLVKTIPIGTLLLEIEPEDTQGLTMKAVYVYDIQYTDEYGHVDTPIQGTFTIGEEVM